ncbi:hypothetical protein LW90_00705 [Taylorella equigenitalis]|nr:hypothetical protein LW90_00705 [Taylorella equigenitalis]
METSKLRESSQDLIGLDVKANREKIIERLLPYSLNEEYLNNEVVIILNSAGEILYIDLLENKYLVDLLEKVEGAHSVEVYRFQEKSAISYERDRDYFLIDEIDLNRKGYEYTDYFYLTKEGNFKLEI